MRILRLRKTAVLFINLIYNITSNLDIQLGE